MSANDLGLFLRSRREAITPADVGLPGGSRRRTPGLRRSELATLAGVSVEYLARLEQGRDRHPSVQVLAALADVLRLSAEDRLQLRFTAKAAVGDTLTSCPASVPPPRSVRPTVRALLDQLEPAAAVVLNRLSELLAYTAAFERLARPIGLLDGEHPSLIRFAFTDDRARAAFPEWELVADQQVAAFRIDALGGDPHLAELADELTITAGTPFAERLALPPAPRGSNGVLRLAHPGAGELRLAMETLDLSGDDQRLVVYLPADSATTAALDRLNDRLPGTLRAVR